MVCNACGNKAAYSVRVIYDAKQGCIEQCDVCSPPTTAIFSVPDIYWPGHAHYNANICDNMGNPILLTSRGHKARIMKEQGLREVGDKFHGTRDIRR